MSFYDKRPINPAFESELKVLAKRERSFSKIYEESLVPFMLECGEEKEPFLKNYCSISQKHQYKEHIRHVSLFQLNIGNDSIYYVIKYRSHFENGSFSEGPRISFVICQINDINDTLVIPLEVYTHGNKSTNDATSVPELKKKLLNVLGRINQSRNQD